MKIFEYTLLGILFPLALSGPGLAAPSTATPDEARQIAK